jgi:cbb3-type cytochrome oxidase subunit 3
MAYSDLLVWWSVSISWSAVFLIAVSLYLYWDRRKRHPEGSRILNRFRLSDFVFVWVLAGLLCLYIVSIYRGSSLIFAAGNIVVEAILVVYTLKHRLK